MRFFQRRPKVFCLGRNKTGTTSLELALRQFGYRLGDQAKAEMLIEDWAQRDFRRIIQLCQKADAFQDIPFSLPFTYQAVDAAFPGSRFILSVRSSADEWYTSLTKHHARLAGTTDVPTADALRTVAYRGAGWLLRTQHLVYGVDDNTVYDREIYCNHYRRHNEQVLEYFRYRPQDLLVLNLADADAMPRLCNFLGMPYNGESMPHENRMR